MPRFATFLQLLLALVLVLNGIGSAFAGASMQVTAVAGDAAAATHAAGMEDAHAGCPGLAPVPSAQDDGSCGGSGYCDFACAQILALMPPAHEVSLRHQGDVGAEYPPTGHQAPALAGVTRPPIA